MKKNLLFHASKVKVQTKYNYFQWVAKEYNKFKKNTQISWDAYFFYYLPKQKISNLNSYATFILSTNLSDYSTSLNKSHDFQTLFAIFSFSRTSVRSIAVKFRDKHASTI